MLALEGRQLGNYDVIRRIRVGGMGAVYEGRQRTAFGRRVAIKVILGSYAADREMRRRFAREARVVARLHHPHILPLIEFGDEQGILYLVMPFIEGGTLTSYLRHSLPDLSEVATIFLQLLDAVECAHEEGLIHRDIKSSNVLLEQRRSGPPYAYLGDFGLVRTLQADATPTRTQIPLDQVPGTPHYMAPEQTYGIVTPATDIYALGVLLYQMLVGELPYDDPDEIEVIQMHLHAEIPSPCAHDASIPAPLDDVVRTAMAKQAADRFKNIAEFREAFLAALNGPGMDVIEDLDADAPDELSPAPVILSPLAPTQRARPLSAPLKPYTRPLDPDVPAMAPSVASSQLQRRADRDTLSIPPRASHIALTRQGSKRRSRRLPLLISIVLLVPILLLSLILVPRVLGISLFPASIPLLGSSSIATVTVTAQSRNFHDSYLLTASPHAQGPDVGARVIPDHSLSTLVNGSRIVGTSGTKDIPGSAASGNLLFVNTSLAPAVVGSGMRFTATNGVQLQLMQGAVVPPRRDRQNGGIFVPAVVVTNGATGNIAPESIFVNCCAAGVSVSNPAAFSGGVDDHTARVVTQDDLNGVRNAISSDLRQRALQQLQSQLWTNEVLANSPTYTTNVTADHVVGDQTDQVQVKVTMIAKAVAYNRETARQVVLQLANQRGAQTFGSTFQLSGNPNVAQPRIVQHGANNLLYLSVSVNSIWVYRLSPDQVSQWRQSIKGASPSLALTYLDAQPGVSSAQVHLPFGASILPNNVDDIEIVLVGAS